MTKATVNGILLKYWAYLIISLSLSTLACQTSQPNSAEEPASESRILETQKQLVRNHLDSGQPELALKTMRDLLRAHPDDASLQSLMGLTQLALHNPSRSVQHFARAYKLERQPSHALNLSSAYIEAGSPEKALALLASLLKSKKESDAYRYRERIFHNIGYAYTKLGQPKKAETWLSEAVEENPTFFPSHLELARLYEKTKRLAQAEKSYRRAADYCHVCFEPVQALANIYIRLGNPAEARKVLTRFTKVDGIASSDRAKAEALMKASATAGLNRRRAG